MKKLYDDENNIRRKEKNGKFLFKNYRWGNMLDWIVSDKDYYYIPSCEMDKLLDSGLITIVDNFKEGKKLLNNGGKYEN